MNDFDPGVTHDWPRSDPYDGLGESAYYGRLYSASVAARRGVFEPVAYPEGD